MKVEISVLTRTEGNGRRIIEGVYADKKKAEADRQDLIKRFASRPDLLADTEIDTREVDVPVFVIGKMDADARELAVDAFATESAVTDELRKEVTAHFGDGSRVVDGWVDGVMQSCAGGSADSEFATAMQSAKCEVAGELSDGDYVAVTVSRL